MLVIYFDHRPKETKEDLYDREEELSQLHSSISEPIILLTGIRRIGKTSVLKVFLNDLDLPYALIDVRTPLSSYKSLYTIFSEVLSQINKKKGVIKEILQHINGISFFGVNISLSWDPKTRPSLQAIMDRINEIGKVVIAFDEAQNLKGKIGNEFLSLLAHCYDYCKNVTFILTGSEIGLLYDFLKIEDPSSPLFGRHIEEIRLNRFSSEKSLDFLRQGFRQVGINASENVLEYAVEKLDGMVGWLTEFGYRCVKAKELRKEFVDEILELASKTVSEELSHFSKEYVIIIEGIAKGYTKWNEIKRYFEEKKKRTIYDAELRRYLDKLEKRGYVNRVDRGKYELTDPVVKNAFAR
ncbi:ATP-binding protein [Sulfolobus tengchongensis]|uniref:ATP-binding protein n=1 Tax=Sulfolobus tengchongensis TaxID=207809 RepID=A0AAX4L189_9CREN